MPRIKRTESTSIYKSTVSDSSKFNENRDCTVIALSIATGVSYDKIHEELRRLGRKRGHGTSIANMKECCLTFGFKMERWTWRQIQDVIETYPSPHNRLHNITTHHPRRFAAQWMAFAGSSLIFHVRRHVAAVVNGQVHDWSINSSKIVQDVYEITKL